MGYYVRKVDDNRSAEHNWYPSELDRVLSKEYKHFCALLCDYMKYQNSPGTITPATALGELDSAGKLIVCPQLMQIVRAALCLPTRSASVERGFSVHRVNEHRLTSKMGVLVFDALMRLMMLGGEYMPLQGS
jgi:hypothetical protein